MKQRYLKAGHKQIPVTEDVYLAAARWKENLVRNTRSNGLAPDDLLIRNSTHIAASADEQGFGVMRCEGRGMAYMGFYAYATIPIHWEAGEKKPLPANCLVKSSPCRSIRALILRIYRFFTIPVSVMGLDVRFG